MASRRLFRRLVDSNSLAALGYSEYADLAFTSVGMTVTANCFKELRAGRTITATDTRIELALM